MRIDHVMYAAENDGLQATAERLSQQLGIEVRDGGVHPRFGTRNMIPVSYTHLRAHETM